MKLVKTASGKKLKISKKEWQSIGKKAGWMKKAREEGFEGKSPQIQENIKKVAPNPDAFSGNDSCAICKAKVNPETDFKDELSIKEWKISRMCQKCQDGFFE